MILIIGGAYQGKLSYAMDRFSLKKEEVFFCTQERAQIDFSQKAAARLEEFALVCVREKKEARTYLQERREQWKDHILLCADISAGVVPVESELRAWREMTGRMLAYLSRESEETIRMFCGIAQRLK